MLAQPPRVGVVVVTSPARRHPSTELTDSVLNSLDLIEGIDGSPTAIVCDGCRSLDELEPAHAARLSERLAANPIKFSKRGIVSNEIAAAYGVYKRRLRSSGRELLELDSHHGFALAVREGLRWAQGAGCTHALVCQHDRRFVRRLPAAALRAILGHFAAEPSCRYVGFPSGTSKRLASRTHNEYRLGDLLRARTVPLPPGDAGTSLSLRPSIFWYDSNHLVHVERALELLYQLDPLVPYGAPRRGLAFRHAPAALHLRLGANGAARFRLRRGDFIEERFGVEQLEALKALAREPLEAQLAAFDFFGSYLLQESTSTAAMAGTAADEEAGAAAPPCDDGRAVRSRARGADPAHAGGARAPGGFAPGQVDRQGLVTHVEHIDGRGHVPPSQRRRGALRRERREGRASAGRWVAAAPSATDSEALGVGPYSKVPSVFQHTQKL